MIKKIMIKYIFPKNCLVWFHLQKVYLALNYFYPQSHDTYSITASVISWITFQRYLNKNTLIQYKTVALNSKYTSCSD